MNSPLAITSLIAIITTTLNCTAAEPSRAVKELTPANAGCVTIPSSGLTWELKTDDGGIHDKDNVYRWGGTGAQRTGSIFFDDWNSLLIATNKEKLCGFDDWRVPTIEELKTLVVNVGKNPVIDTAVFPLTLAAPYWSASSYQRYPEHAQTIDFGSGRSNYYHGARVNPLPVRLVRTGAAAP